MLVEKESGPFVEHVDAALKWALYNDAVFHFINVRLTEGLIKALEGLEPTRQSGQIITPNVAIGIRTATRFCECYM